MIETMSHDEAIKDGATERYVLEEMTDEERDAFEEHYFECVVCAEDVRAAIAVREGLAAEQRHQPIPAVIPFEPRQRRLPASLAAAAAAMIAVVSMYAGVVQPKQKQLAEALKPHIVDEYMMDAVRGPETTAKEIRNRRHATTLKVDLEAPGDRSPRYMFVVVDAAGVQQFAIPVDGEEARTTMVSIGFPSESFKPGTYTLRVDGTEAGLASFRFTVK
jgi:hypothetical protein